VLSLTLAVVAKISARGEPVVLRTNLENLPMQLAGYQGVEDTFPQDVYNILQADFHLYRHYHKPQEELSVYIGYYGTAKGGRTGHNPYACLPGSGWGVVDRQPIVLKTPYAPQGVEVNAVVARKGEVYNVMLHWYQSAGTKILATGLQQNLQRFWGRLLYNRNDGAYIQLSSLVGEKDISSTKENLSTFAEQVLVLIPEYWPEEASHDVGPKM
jgi:EpsI family protein